MHIITTRQGEDIISLVNQVDLSSIKNGVITIKRNTCFQRLEDYFLSGAISMDEFWCMCLDQDDGFNGFEIDVNVNNHKISQIDFVINYCLVNGRSYPSIGGLIDYSKLFSFHNPKLKESKYVTISFRKDGQDGFDEYEYSVSFSDGYSPKTEIEIYYSDEADQHVIEILQLLGLDKAKDITDQPSRPGMDSVYKMLKKRHWSNLNFRLFETEKMHSDYLRFLLDISVPGHCNWTRIPVNLQETPHPVMITCNLPPYNVSINIKDQGYRFTFNTSSVSHPVPIDFPLDYIPTGFLHFQVGDRIYEQGPVKKEDIALGQEILSLFLSDVPYKDVEWIVEYNRENI